MAAGKMGISRLTKKSSTKHSSNTTPLTTSITASKELQDIGGLLTQPSPIQSSHSSHHSRRLATPTPQPSSPFLRMPPEIRYEIYRYLIPTPAKRFWPLAFALPPLKKPTPTSWCTSYHPTTAKSISKAKSGTARTTATPLSILLVNKLIYHEALSVLYSEHLFHFIGPNYLPVLEFIRKLGPDARSQIRQIRLTLLAQEMGGQIEGQHDLFCTVIHEACPGLTTLKADPVVWL